MSKFGIKFDTTSEERRDIFYAALIAALNVAIGPGDKAVITFEFERPTFRGKRKVVNTVEWEDGQEPPTFADIGIYATQYDLFAQPATGRTYTAPIGGEDQADATTTVEEDDTGVGDITQPWTEPAEKGEPPAVDAHEKGLDIFRQFLAQLDNPPADDQGEDDDQTDAESQA